MPSNRLLVLPLLASLLAACAQQTPMPDVPERGSADYLKVRDSIADEVYVDPVLIEQPAFNDVRRIYIAPANTATTQIIQPHGVRSGDLDAWVMTPAEEEVLQNTLVRVFTEELERQQAFDVVEYREDAQWVLYSTVVALHPNRPRSVAMAGERVGGAVTMSFSLVDQDSGTVAVRALDSKSTDRIYSFNRMTGEAGAVEVLLRAWGGQIRRSLMYLQGRYVDPLMGPVQLKPQK
jgi:hypothetical protein